MSAYRAVHVTGAVRVGGRLGFGEIFQLQWSAGEEHKGNYQTQKRYVQPKEKEKVKTNQTSPIRQSSPPSSETPASCRTLTADKSPSTSSRQKAISKSKKYANPDPVFPSTESGMLYIHLSTLKLETWDNVK